MQMTDDELAATIWPIYCRYIGKLHTPETRADFRADVHAVLGPDDDDQILLCDVTNNPPTVVASGGLCFYFYFKRDRDLFWRCLTSDDLLRAHRAGSLP